MFLDLFKRYGARVVAATFFYLLPLKTWLIWLLDWRGRVDALAQTYSDLGGWRAVIGYVLNPPPWLPFLSAVVGTAVIVVPLIRQNSELKRRLEAAEQSPSASLNGSKPYEIVIGTGSPYETVTEGKFKNNKCRQLSVAIKNNTNKIIAGACIKIVGLNPPQEIEGFSEPIKNEIFTLKRDLIIPAQNMTLVEIAHYWEGSDKANPDDRIRLNIPIPNGIYDADSLCELPVAEYTFHLNFESPFEKFCDVYCKMFIDENGLLRLVDWGDSSKRQTVIPNRQDGQPYSQSPLNTGS